MEAPVAAAPAYQRQETSSLGAQREGGRSSSQSSRCRRLGGGRGRSALRSRHCPSFSGLAGDDAAANSGSISRPVRISVHSRSIPRHPAQPGGAWRETKLESPAVGQGHRPATRALGCGAISHCTANVPKTAFANARAGRVNLPRPARHGPAGPASCRLEECEGRRLPALQGPARPPIGRAPMG